MKKTFTILKIAFVALAVFSMMQISAQIEDLDPSYYYMIQSIKSDAGIQPALGINVAEIDMDEALLEKQVPDGITETQLWQVIPVSDNTYKFKNKGSGMALGRTSWRGKRPDITNDPTNVWHFDAWSGHPPHFGACQRIWAEGDSSQMWTPLKYDLVNDTARYRMNNADNFNDSTWNFNLWRNTAVIETDPTLVYQNKNIALADGELESSEAYADGTSNLAFFFAQSFLEVPPSVINNSMVENITVYSSNGSIILKGEIYGKDVQVYSILGTKVYTARVNSSELNIPVRKGLYIVKAGRYINKLVVK
jgi:hypothetical protein